MRNITISDEVLLILFEDCSFNPKICIDWQLDSYLHEIEDTLSDLIYFLDAHYCKSQITHLQYGFIQDLVSYILDIDDQDSNYPERLRVTTLLEETQNAKRRN